MPTEATSSRSARRTATCLRRCITPCSNATYTLLYSHGNGEDIGWLDELFKWYNELGFSVFAYDYRGYGLSTGTPDEDECYADADAVFAYLTNAYHVPPERIIVHGRSLGGAMAVHLASRRSRWQG